MSHSHQSFASRDACPECGPIARAAFDARRRIRHMPEPTFGIYTDRARSVLQLAEAEAERLGHHYIGTEHILLGLIREGGGIGAGVLESLGVDLPKARAAVEFVIGGPR